MREIFVDLVKDPICSVGYTNLHVQLIHDSGLQVPGVSIPLHSKNH